MSTAVTQLTCRIACLALLATPGVCAAAGGADARLSSATNRCSELAELIACGEALSIKPDDPDLLMAEADALVRHKRPGEAIGVYRNASRHGAPSSTVSSRIAAAATLRRSLLSQCLTRDGFEAEKACDSAWLPGSSDEVSVFKRRGQLLQAQDQPQAAFEAYLAAARLRPQDRGVAQAVVALRAAGGRMDARTLATVGTAFMTLGHRAQAISAFRQALRLEPEIPGVKDRLRLAEHPASALDDAAERGGTDAAANRMTDGVAAAASDDAKLFTNEAAPTRSN